MLSLNSHKLSYMKIVSKLILTLKDCVDLLWIELRLDCGFLCKFNKKQKLDRKLSSSIIKDIMDILYIFFHIIVVFQFIYTNTRSLIDCLRIDLVDIREYLL